MNTYIVPVMWRVTTSIMVEADSREAAIEAAYNRNISTIPDATYIDDSFIVDEDDIETEEGTEDAP